MLILDLHARSQSMQAYLDDEVFLSFLSDLEFANLSSWLRVQDNRPGISGLRLSKQQRSEAGF
jgi:hypothetical protein